MKQSLIIVLALLAVAASARSAIQLKSTPVQELMAAEVSSSMWSDLNDFDEAKPKEGRKLEFEQDLHGKKSVAKAAVLSMLVPGGGQYYLGKRKKARYFFAGEILTWVGYYAFHSYGDMRKDDYIRYAAVKAHAQLEDKDDEFVDWVGFYDSIDDFNGAGRVGDPGRPYLPDTPEYHWQWGTVEDRITFREMKTSSRNAYVRSDIMLGIAVMGRVVSIVDAVRDGLRQGRQLRSPSKPSNKPGFKFSFDPLSKDRQISLAVYPGL